MADNRSLGRSNAIVFASWTDADRAAFWQHYSNQYQLQSNAAEPNPTSACHIWTGSTQNGYPAVSMGHGRPKVKMHILGCWTRHHRVPSSSEVVSHLCHRKLCINPDHLVIESIGSNNLRRGCLCCFRGQDDRVYGLCPHNPRCLRRDTDTVGIVFQPFVLFDPNWF